MKGLRGKTGHFVAPGCLALACVSLAGCGSQAPAAVTQATVPATTIPPIDPHAVPTHITAAYVQGVLNELDAVDGDAARLIVANRSLVPAAVYRLEAIDADSWFSEDTSTLTDELAHGLQGY